MDVAVIIVSYNTSDYIKQAIDSVLIQEGVQFEIIVVDNASTDSSVDLLTGCGDKIQLIASKENLGFGKANNLAAKYAVADYLFLLNPDAALQAKGDLKEIVSFVRNHSSYGLVSARVVNPDGNEETVPKTTYPGEQYIGYPYKDLPGSIAWVLGACMIIPRVLYEQVGGFDEGYFLYAEDADLCLRIRKAGYKIAYFTDVSISHVGGGSERKTGWYQLTEKKQKALFQFYKKHYKLSDVKMLLAFELRRARKRRFLSRLRNILTLGLLTRPKDEKHDAICHINASFLKDLSL